MRLRIEDARASLSEGAQSPSDVKVLSPLFALPSSQHEPPIEEGEILSTILQALESKDKYTRGHGQRVSAYSERLAREMKLSEEDIIDIRIGGMLHDIGKIKFSDRIFSDENVMLSKEMHAEILSHPWAGRTILESLHFNQSVLDYVYYHHERVDGNGYPCGLCKDEIPLGAQIISVADCFDAMTTDRPYQPRKHLSEALTALDQMSGTVLSCKCVDVFMDDILKNGTISQSPE